ncbi:MAG: hypothetical protein DCC67_07430 [Planctomycetota bacterium]|nr:MAG: hypothetical protein DCC67_07430 [Planctomycetota bacterium]
MNHSPGAVTAVRWTSLFPWLVLVRAARVALLLRVLALALAGIEATDVGWQLVERTLLDGPSPSGAAPLRRLDESPPTYAPRGATPAVPQLPSGPAWRPDAAAMVHGRSLAFAGDLYGSPLIRGWRWAMHPLVSLREARGARQWIGYALAGGWAVAVWALFGGAIARIAAVYLCYGETIGPLAALRSAWRTWRSTAGALLISAIGVLVLALPLVAAGLLLRFDLTAALLGLAWFAVLLAGLVFAVALIGVAIGWPMMWATVAVERTDGFDAVSRAIGYVYQRPLHLAFYVLVASVLGLVAQAAVNLVVDGAFAATGWAVSIGSSSERLAELQSPRDARGWARGWARGGMAWWNGALALVAAGFPMAYLWPAAVGVYLLQRRHIDSTEMTDLKFDERESPRGLPPLATDPETGVPRLGEPAATTS